MQFLFSLEEVLDATQRTQQVRGLVRQIDGLGLIALSQLLHHLDILLSQQVVGGIGALAHSFGDEFDGLCLSLSLTDRRSPGFEQVGWPVAWQLRPC